MKTLLSFLFLLVSHCLFAQGPKVLGPLQRNGASDTYPTHLATLGKGGIHQVDDVAARDAIPADLRVENMVAIVKADGKWYKLAGGILNANWQEITFATPTPPLDDVLTAGNSSMQDMNIGKMFVNNGKLLVKEDGLFTIDADYAIAQFSSTSRGVTFPAMTTVERNAIGGGFPPGKSLFVYDVNLDKFCYYDGTSWRVIHPAVNLTTTGSGAPTLDAATNTINIPQTVSAYAHYYETGGR
ncbi:MAG TPA: hypothetical protein VEB42_10445, partial [Chitinophagaceae bacterium]|nr:hypothetical protein [Chitinophagaceae bacterium]